MMISVQYGDHHFSFLIVSPAVLDDSPTASRIEGKHVSWNCSVRFKRRKYLYPLG
jgi:hypothetical protein